MSLFSTILDELSRKIHGAELYKSDIAKIVSEEVGVEILPDDLQIKNKSLYIQTSPTIKTAILLKKQKIINLLKSYNINSIV